MVSLTELLASAIDAGLTIHRDGDRLVVRGPRSAGDIVRRLLARKTEVLATLTPVSSPPIALKCAYDPIPAHIIRQLLERTSTADGATGWRMFPLFPGNQHRASCEYFHERC